VAVFEWSQRWRAGALLLRPVQPVHDPGLADGLAELRQLLTRLGAALAAGGDTAHLRARQRAVEAAIRDNSRRSRVGEAAQLSAPPTASDVRARLGGAVLVEYLEAEGRLHAIVVSDGVRLHRLADSAEVAADLAGLRHGLRRLASRAGSSRSVFAARVLVEERARRLDEALLQPLAGEIGESPLVLIPTGALHAVPWAALASCAARPVSVAPSAALWHRAAGSGDSEPAGPQVFVAGPGLTHAVPEVRAVSRRYPGAHRFAGRNARVADVSSALDGASLAHVAAHGRFRSDNPLFSALDLADGPLTVYDLEGLRRPPHHVILSACDSGLSAVHPGDELLGLAGALLSMGSRSLIASVVPVPDAEARTLMVRLHRYLRAGMSPAAALTAARKHMDSADPHARAVATGFLCFGAG
jgi:transcription elongation GreA/GreB family factor